MSDIVERLNRAGDLAIPGEPCGIFYDAANEIERLRLTDEEREVLGHEVELAEYQQRHDVVATLRGLLERTSGTHATPALGSVQGE